MTDAEDDDGKFDDVEVGDKIVFNLPHGEYEGEEVTGGVGDVGDDWLVAKAGGYYRVGREDFVGIEEKQAF